MATKFHENRDTNHIQIKVLMIEFRDSRYAARAFKEARSLSGAGYDVTYVSYNQSLSQQQVYSKESVTFYELANPTWGRRAKFFDAVKRYFLGLILIVRMNLIPVFWRAQVYHVHDLKVLPGGIVAKLVHRGWLVYDAHELHMAKHASTTIKKRFLNTFNFYLEKLALPAVDLVIHASEQRAAYVKSLYKIPMPVVLENHSLRQNVSGTSNLRILCNLKDRDFLLLYIGGIVLGTFKKVDRVIDALPLLNRRIHFCLLGPCSDVNRLMILDKAHHLNISERIHLLEPVPTEQLVSFISSADLCVIPVEASCLNEEYSALNKLSESCMAGVPVIATDIANLHTLIYENPVGPIGETFNIKDINSLASTVIRCTSKTLLRLYRRNAIQLAHDFLNWEQQEDRLLKAYRDMMQSR